MFKNKSGMKTSQNTRNSKHECAICGKRRGGCTAYPKKNRNGKPSWICFHCRTEKEEQWQEKTGTQDLQINNNALIVMVKTELNVEAGSEKYQKTEQ